MILSNIFFKFNHFSQAYEYENLNNPKFIYLKNLFGIEIDWENLRESYDKPDVYLIIDYSEYLIQKNQVLQKNTFFLINMIM